MSEKARPPEADLYDELSAEFPHTFRDLRGGVELEYITGEQATSRLNDALGFLAWSFVVKEHGIHHEADECWALGVLTVTVGDRTVIREQFGSQKIKRSRSSGMPLDIGFDLKGAATDALKKCASLVGVGLYLHEKEPQAPPKPAAKPAPKKDAPKPANLRPVPPTESNDEPSFTCEECGDALTETRFKDGTVWSASHLAVFGQRKHSRVLCMAHYREANQARRRAEEAMQQVPF